MKQEGVAVPAHARLEWKGTDPRSAIDPLGCLSAAAIAVGISQAAQGRGVVVVDNPERRLGEHLPDARVSPWFGYAPLEGPADDVRVAAKPTKP